MKRSTVIWFLAALFASAGLGEIAAQAKDAPKPALKRAISVGTAIQDWLQIHSDGSGTVGYGDGGGPFQGHFKAGTFDVGEVTRQLKEMPIDAKGGWRTHYYFSFESERKGPEQPGPSYHTLDRKLIPSLFEKAIQASGMKKEHLPKGFGELKVPPP